MPHPVIDAALNYRAQLLAQEQTAATRLIVAYGRAYAALENERRALEEYLALRGVNDVRGTQADIRRLSVVRSLNAQIQREVGQYAVAADQEIAGAITRSVGLGLEAGRGTVLAYATGGTQTQLAAAWDSLPAEAVETALGFTGPDSPLRTRLTDTLGEAVAQRVTDALVDAIAIGTNPREVARLLQQQLGLGLTWSLTTARTAQLWSYREATRQSYLANRDIVGGWRWWSALDRRTCPACLAQHGRLYPVDEVLNGHHNCRCVAVPDVPLARQLGIAPLPDTTGEQWLRNQQEADQRAQLGPGLYAAWQAGLPFDRLPTTYEDAVYGTMVRTATLKELQHAH